MHMDMWEVDDELPYLYSETRENKNDRRHDREPNPNHIYFNDLTLNELHSCIRILNISYAQQNRLINSIEVKAKNPIFSLKHNNNLVIITVCVKNEYLESEFILRFNTDDDEFYILDFYHHYDGLESMGWFKREFERVKREAGMDFYSYYFGFNCKFDGEHLTVCDSFEVHVTFGDGDFFTQHPEYNVDFENRRLEFYHMIEGHEINAGFI